MRFPYVAIASLTLFLSLPVLATPPASDNFVDATPLSGTNVTTTGSNTEATREIGEPNHAAPGGRSVWWTWTAPGSGSAIVQTTGSSFDTLLAAYTSTTVNSLTDTLVASNDDSGSAETSLIVFAVTAGTNYHIVVDGYNGETGTIALAVSYRSTPIPATPPNDNFANRIKLQGLVATALGGNYFATKETNEPSHAEEMGGASVWWSWVAPVSGTVQVDTLGSDFDTLLAVYRGSSLTNLALVFANDDASTNSSASLVSFSAVGGMEYQIAVDGFDGQPGDIQLHVQTSIVILGNPERLDDGTYRFTLTGPLGKQYAIERSTDLATWQRLSTLDNPNGTLDFSDPEPNLSPQHFYRAVQLPN